MLSITWREYENPVDPVHLYSLLRLSRTVFYSLHYIWSIRMKWFIKLLIEVLVVVIAGGVAVWFIIEYLGGC